jgi:hypothetical protein
LEGESQEEPQILVQLIVLLLRKLYYLKIVNLAEKSTQHRTKLRGVSDFEISFGGLEEIELSDFPDFVHYEVNVMLEMLFKSLIEVLLNTIEKIEVDRKLCNLFLNYFRPLLHKHGYHFDEMDQNLSGRSISENWFYIEYFVL